MMSTTALVRYVLGNLTFDMSLAGRPPPNGDIGTINKSELDMAYLEKPISSIVVADDGGRGRFLAGHETLQQPLRLMHCYARDAMASACQRT